MDAKDDGARIATGLVLFDQKAVVAIALAKQFASVNGIACEAVSSGLAILFVEGSLIGGLTKPVCHDLAVNQMR